MSFNRFPTAPALGEEGGESSGSGLYPSLHEQATMPRLAMNMNKMVKTLMILKMVMMTVIRVRAKVLAIMLMTNMEMMVKTVMAHKSTKLDFGDNEVLKPIFCQIIHLINLFKSKSQLPLCDAWGHCRSWHQVYQATSTGSVNLNTNHFRSMPTSNLNPKLA